MPAARRSVNPFRVLVVHRNFRLFWSGQTVSLVGTWMQSVALGWLTLLLTDSVFLVGLVAAVGSFPVLVLSLPAGVLADRVDRLRLIIGTQVLFGVQATLLWWVTWTGHVTVGWLLALATMSGVLQAVDVPARQSMIMELVGREDLVDAIALNSTGFNLARIVGPGLAGILIAKLGIAWCFGLNAVSYVAVLVGLFLIHRVTAPPPPATVSPMEGMLQGLRYIRDTRTVSVLVRQTAVFSVFGIPYLTLMPVYARDGLGLDAGGYGVLLSAVGVGAVVGALSLAAFGNQLRRGRLLYAALFTFAAALLALAIAGTLQVAVAVLLVAGLAMIVNNALTNGLLQTISPDALRGRVMSAYSLVFIGMSPIGSLLAGATARSVGVAQTLAAGALIVAGYAAYTYTRHPAVREL